ncbi:uncharacterized protein B4U79_04700, partial [Dinothrombium tinctorium]
IQWGANGGKCGICGDSYNGPRRNELPDGIYARDLVITRSYREGSIIKAKVQITANHKGFFVFKICPAKSMDVEVTQECLDDNVLEIVGSNDEKYVLPTTKPKTFEVPLRLPPGLTCDRCVLQWTYIAGNNWGRCSNGVGRVGCGKQETFRACADIKIGRENEEEESESNIINSTSISTRKPAITFRPPKRFTRRPIPSSTIPEEDKPDSNAGIRCFAANFRTFAMDQWCQINCRAGFCPPSHCVCSEI